MVVLFAWLSGRHRRRCSDAFAFSPDVVTFLHGHLLESASDPALNFQRLCMDAVRDKGGHVVGLCALEFSGCGCRYDLGVFVPSNEFILTYYIIWSPRQAQQQAHRYPNLAEPNK
jgi:hypothetical protein